MIVPVQVNWHDPSGLIVKENGQAKEVNAQGGLLEMRTCPGVGCQVELTNLLSAEATQARVVAIRHSKEGVARGIAVELLVPSEAFWGVNYQLRRTTAALLKLEECIKSGGLDPRVLREFRDAVDYVRKTAWVVQEWQERQLQRRDTSTVLPLLTAERVRRATQLSEALAKDLEAREVTSETAGIDELFRALEHICQHLARLLGERKPQ